MAAPLWRTVVQREREAELLFRLGEFRKAIAAYQAAHKRFPQKLEDLLEDRTQLATRRYLR
ncbi:MAG: type II secretion system protein, partial [candidate division NC10 bacterium]|nr:type II secretion system protein [candidate division NC10 bacterium]